MSTSINSIEFRRGFDLAMQKLAAPGGAIGPLVPQGAAQAPQPPPQIGLGNNQPTLGGGMGGGLMPPPQQQAPPPVQAGPKPVEPIGVQGPPPTPPTPPTVPGLPPQTQPATMFEKAWNWASPTTFQSANAPGRMEGTVNELKDRFTKTGPDGQVVLNQEAVLTPEQQAGAAGLAEGGKAVGDAVTGAKGMFSGAMEGLQGMPEFAKNVFGLLTGGQTSGDVGGLGDYLKANMGKTITGSVFTALGVGGLALLLKKLFSGGGDGPRQQGGFGGPQSYSREAYGSFDGIDVNDANFQKVLQNPATRGYISHLINDANSK